MTAYAIDEKLCVECGQCRRFCPIKNAIVINAEYQHTVIADLCSGCGLCEAFCPVPGALFQIGGIEQPQAKPLKTLRRVVWRHQWGFHNHPLMGEITLKARQTLRAARRQERLQFAAVSG